MEGTQRRGRMEHRATCIGLIANTAAKIRAGLSSEQLTARPGVIPAYAASASALLAVLGRWRGEVGERIGLPAVKCGEGL